MRKLSVVNVPGINSHNSCHFISGLIMTEAKAFKLSPMLFCFSESHCGSRRYNGPLWSLPVIPVAYFVDMARRHLLIIKGNLKEPAVHMHIHTSTVHIHSNIFC